MREEYYSSSLMYADAFMWTFWIFLKEKLGNKKLCWTFNAVHILLEGCVISSTLLLNYLSIVKRKTFDENPHLVWAVLKISIHFMYTYTPYIVWCSKKSFILNGLHNNRLGKQIAEVMVFDNSWFWAEIVQSN